MITSTNKMQESIKLGAEFWNDSCDPQELQRAVECGATGATSNPVIVAAAIKNNENHYRHILQTLMSEQALLTEDELTWKLIESLGLEAANLLLPVYERTQGLQGKLCLQVSPAFHTSSELMTSHGIQLASLAKNIAIKVPASQEGLKTIESLASKGISTNATVSFSVSQSVACAEAVERGLTQARKDGIDLKAHSSWCTIMIGRVDVLRLPRVGRLDECGQRLQRLRAELGVDGAAELAQDAATVGGGLANLMKKETQFDIKVL